MSLEALKPSPVVVEEIDVSSHPQYMGHEKVFRFQCGHIRGFVGVHSTALGPALGGIRYKHYPSEDAALTDALRLSEAMTWKNSAIGLNHGGGKSVIMGIEDEPYPSLRSLQIMADALNEINKESPLYYGAQDMNVSEEAIDQLAFYSKWIRGKTSKDESIVGGTPSPLTAMAVVECIKVAAAYKLGRETLEGVKIAHQGLGTVGGEMARLLDELGADQYGCDTNEAVFEAMPFIKRIGLDDIYDVKADIFAPNAIGGTITKANIERLEKACVRIVCGAANNQQQDQSGGTESKILHRKGILYSPDYIVNAGGVFWVAEEGKDAETARQYIRTKVAEAFRNVLKLADENPDTDMSTLARQYAEARVNAAG